MPDISRQITVHAYKSGEFVRAITLGMAKAGLPDVVIDEFSWSINGPMGNLINLFCQAIAEGNKPATAGEFDLEIGALAEPGVRETALATLKPNAKPVARLWLKEGIWEDGDPDNWLVEIAFDRLPGTDVHARQDALPSTLFGSEDSITPVKHDAELLEASKKAVAELPALNRAFAAGLQPGEIIRKMAEKAE